MNGPKPAKPVSKDDVFFGMPVQIVTGAPCETSLRLQKQHHSNAPAYDYECRELERKEWARCIGPIHREIQAAVERDADGTAPDDIPALAIAYQLAAILVAAFIAFQKKGWVTGRANPSFAPRNFGSGPRDSPDWMPFTKEVAEKEGFSLQTTELENLKSSLRDYIGLSLSVNDHWQQLVKDKNSFPGTLSVLIPPATGKSDLLDKMNVNARKSPAGTSASARLAREFVKDLIGVNGQP